MCIPGILGHRAGPGSLRPGRAGARARARRGGCLPPRSRAEAARPRSRRAGPRSAARWPRPGCSRTTSGRRPSAGRSAEGRERLDPARLSDLWRMHGRLAVARGEPSRGIAFLTKALKQAERAHDSRAIGLAHYELGLCYRQVGDMAIVREHITSAASALHAAGDRRHLAMVHSLSGVTLAQEGRLDEAMAALRQAERLAGHGRGRRRAGDGLRQPGQRGADAAPARSGAGARRAQRRAAGAGGHAARARRRAGLARADLRAGRQSEARGRSAQSCARRPQPAAVHARDDRRRVRYARADPPDPRRARPGQPQPAEGPRGLRRDAREPLVSVVGPGARGAARAAPRGCRRGRSTVAAEVAGSGDAPGVYALQAELIAIEALLALGRTDDAQQRLEGDLRPRAARRDERDVGRVSAAARPAPRRGRPRDRGVSRFRPERQRVRSAGRAISGRPQPPRAGQAGRGRRRAIARDALPHRRHGDLRVAGRGARSRGRPRPR